MNDPTARIMAEFMAGTRWMMQPYVDLAHRQRDRIDQLELRLDIARRVSELQSRDAL